MLRLFWVGLLMHWTHEAVFVDGRLAHALDISKLECGNGGGRSH